MPIIIHPIWTWLWNISFFLSPALIIRTLYTVLLKKKSIELLTNKTYQEPIVFLALLRIERGFPFQRKLKSMKGKQAETMWACNGQGERRGREQQGGPGAWPPGKFWKLKCSETQSGAFLLSWLSIPYSRFCVCVIEIFRIPYIFQVNIQYSYDFQVRYSIFNIPLLPPNRDCC